MKDFFSILGGVIFIIAFIPYIISILKKETKPAKASWIIWGAVDTLALAGMISAGTQNGQIIAAVIGVWIIVLLSFRYGILGWTKLDKICLVSALVGLILWQLFQNPVIGIIASQIIVFIGSFPTFISGWQDPSRENKAAWILFWLSCVCTILAIQHFSLADAIQPITFCLTDSIMMFILLIRPLFIKK